MGTYTVVASFGATTDYYAASATTTFSITAPTIALSGNATVNAGSIYTLTLGQVTDPDPTDTVTSYMIFWGDGTSSGPFTSPLPSGSSPITQTHTYSPPGVDVSGPWPYTIGVTLQTVKGTFSDAGTLSIGVWTGFQVTSFTPTNSGFDIQFDCAANLADVDLYDGLDSNGIANHFGQADVVVTCPSVTNPHTHSPTPIDGSLVWDSTTNTATWVQTSGVLVPDTYTVTLVSQANGTQMMEGWQDSSGNLLNGGTGNLLSSGTGYVTEFTVAASSAPVLSIPCFARGPGQPVNVLPDRTGGNASGYASGLPVMLSDGTNISSFTIELTYNPALLSITTTGGGATGLTEVTGPANWSMSADVYTPGDLWITGSSPDSSSLPSGSQQLLTINATVPFSTTDMYGASELLRFGGGTDFVSTTETSISVLATDAIHKVVFFGDAAGTGARINGYDALLVARDDVQLDTGFYSAPLTDPVIIAGVSGGTTLSAADATLMYQLDATYTVPQIPVPDNVYHPARGTSGWWIDSSTTILPAAIDPTVAIGSVGMIAEPGDTVDAVVRVTDDPHGLQTADFTITYDTQLLNLSTQDVNLAVDTAKAGWSVAANVDNATGVIYVSMSGAPLTEGTPELLDLTFHVRADALAGTSPLTISGLLNGGLLAMTPVAGSIVVVGSSTEHSSTVVAAGRGSDRGASVILGEPLATARSTVRSVKANAAGVVSLAPELGDNPECGTARRVVSARRHVRRSE